MPALPRIRQLRRDKTMFTLALKTVRLQLEEADLLAQRPALREAPDAALLLVQQSIDQWVSISGDYLMHKYRCSLSQALQLLGELQEQLRQGVPVNELRQMPIQEAIVLPPELLASQRQAQG